MIRLLAAGACVTLLLGVARMLAAPIAIATLGHLLAARAAEAEVPSTFEAP